MDLPAGYSLWQGAPARVDGRPPNKKISIAIEKEKLRLARRAAASEGLSLTSEQIASLSGSFGRLEPGHRPRAARTSIEVGQEHM
jgi:hypothetical protein